jgi:trimeric autotransporter adhesin
MRFRSLSWCAVAAAICSALAGSACSNTTTTATPVVAALSGFVVSASTVTGGTTLTGTLTLSSVAPAGGALVAVTSDSAFVVVPQAVTIQVGSTTVSFPITTTATAGTATLTATYANASTTASLTTVVTAVAMLQSIALSSPVSMSGIPVTGTVTLTSPAPTGGAVVALSTNSPYVQVPPSVTVPLGNVSQTFQININNAPSSGSATIAASYAGVGLNTSLALGALALSLGVPSVPGGTAVIGTVAIPAPAPGSGVVVGLSSNSGSAMVPGSVLIPGGAMLQTFTVNTVNVSPTTTATITASVGGSSQAANLTVLAYPNIVSLTCSPTTLTGGGTIQCAGTLAGPAPSGGWRLSFASSDPSVVVPGPLTIPSGSSSFQFAMTTNAVTAATTVSVQIYDLGSGLALWGQIISVTM